MTNYILEIKQEKDKYISPWKISSVIENFASEYYKKFVFDRLINLMPELSENKIPIVFSSSFDLYKKYKKLQNYNMNEANDLENLYYLGDITSMVPDIKIFKLDLIFKLHRSIYSLLNDNGILMDRNKLIDYISVNFNEEKKFDFENLHNYINKLIGEESIELFPKYKKLIKNSEKNLEKFNEDIVRHKIINSLDEKELIDYLKESKNASVYNKYFGVFYQLFNKLSRPIVGIFDKKNGCIEILAKEFLKEDLLESNDQKIEVKELKRNSPMVITFAVGAILIPFIVNVIANELDNKAIKNSKSEPSNNITTNIKVQRLQNAINQLQALSVKDETNEKITNLNDYKAKQGFTKMNKSIKNNMTTTLEKNDFLNSNIKINPEKDESLDEESDKGVDDLHSID